MGEPASDASTTSASSKWRKWTVVKVGLNILEDFVLTALMLLCLSGIAHFIRTLDFNDDFKELFERVHEVVFMMNYLLLALRSLVRLALIPWRDDERPAV